MSHPGHEEHVSLLLAELEAARLALAAEQGRPEGARPGWAVAEVHQRSRYGRTYRPSGARGVVLALGEWYLWEPGTGGRGEVGPQAARGQAPDCWQAQAECDEAWTAWAQRREGGQ